MSQQLCLEERRQDSADSFVDFPKHDDNSASLPGRRTAHVIGPVVQVVPWCYDDFRKCLNRISSFSSRLHPVSGVQLVLINHHINSYSIHPIYQELRNVFFIFLQQMQLFVDPTSSRCSESLISHSFNG